MSRNLIALVLLGGALAVTACAKKPTARGRDFAIPIPSGFASDGEVPVPPDALALFRQTRTADWFRGSIVITPIAATVPPFDSSSEVMCGEVMKAVIAQQPFTAKGVTMHDGPFGRTCRYQVIANDQRQAAVATVVKGPRSLWMLTCNHDPRDVATVEACEAVLRGWRFDP